MSITQLFKHLTDVDSNVLSECSFAKSCTSDCWELGWPVLLRSHPLRSHIYQTAFRVIPVHCSQVDSDLTLTPPQPSRVPPSFLLQAGHLVSCLTEKDATIGGGPLEPLPTASSCQHGAKGCPLPWSVWMQLTSTLPPKTLGPSLMSSGSF